MFISYLALSFIAGAAFTAIFFIVKSKSNNAAAGEIKASLEHQLLEAKNELSKEREKNTTITSDNASLQSDLKNMQEKLDGQKKEVEELQQKFRLEFENIANKLLEEKSKKFTEANKVNLDNILLPLKEKIKDFEKKVENTHKENIEYNAALRQQIIGLKELNEQITKEANNLTKALKGDSKTQGSWGEYSLELILAKAGLEKNIHYSLQSTFKDGNGQMQRPDCIIYLPEDKHIIIDSKVSLRDYDSYFNAEEDILRQRHMKQHIQCIRKHCSDLSNKNYHSLYEINAPDYVLMFFGIEPALTVALQNDDKLFLEALEKNIVLVSTSTLLAILRTVSFIWKQENQKRNVLEIASESGKLYDKFVGLLTDLEKVGERISSTQNAYEDALKKLNGKGNLINKVEKIKELGANASKQIPQKYLDKELN